MGSPHSTGVEGEVRGLDVLSVLEDAVLIEQAGRIVHASGATPRVLKRDPADLVDQPLEDAFAPDDADDLLSTRELARSSGARAACVVRAATDGQRLRCSVTFHPTPEPGTMIVVVRDVEQAERLATAGALLRRITELANEGTNADAALRGAVRDIRATMGWRAGHLLSASDTGPIDTGYWSFADDRDGPDAFVDADDRARMTVPVVVDGHVAAVMEFHASGPIRIDDPLRTLLHDIGRQLGLVVARQRDLDELEASKAELQRSNAELERFAYVASHDLQEPLRKIVGFSELLQQHHDPIDAEEAEFLGYLVDAARRMQRLIKDLLAYSRAGRRQLDPTDVDLSDVVAQVVDDLSLRIEDADIAIEVGALPVVRGDAGQLREVFQNLIANAIKYRATDHDPWIHVEQVEVDDADAVEVVVADNGIGIPPEHRDAVFQVFRRLHPAHVYGGTGLGLALVKVIVERHRGGVWITDGERGQGCQVHVRLPRREGAA